MMRIGFCAVVFFGIWSSKGFATTEDEWKRLQLKVDGIEAQLKRSAGQKINRMKAEKIGIPENGLFYGMSEGIEALEKVSEAYDAFDAEAHSQVNELVSQPLAKCTTEEQEKLKASQLEAWKQCEVFGELRKSTKHICEKDVSAVFLKAFDECADLKTWITDRNKQILTNIEAEFGELSQRILLSVMQGMMYSALINNPAVKRVTFLKFKMGDGNEKASKSDRNAFEAAKKATPFWEPELTFVVEKKEGPYLKIFEIALSRSRLWGASSPGSRSLPKITLILAKNLEESALAPSVAPKDLHQAESFSKPRKTSYEVFRDWKDHVYYQGLSEGGRIRSARVRDFYPMVIDVALGNSSLWNWNWDKEERTLGYLIKYDSGNRAIVNFEGASGSFFWWNTDVGMSPDLLRSENQNGESSWILRHAEERVIAPDRRQRAEPWPVAILRRCDFVGIRVRNLGDNQGAKDHDLYKNWRTPGFCFTAVQVYESVKP